MNTDCKVLSMAEHKAAFSKQMDVLMGKEPEPSDIYDGLASPATDGYNSSMRNESTITPKWIMSGACAAFLVLLGFFGGGYLVLHNDINRLGTKTDDQIARLEAKVDANTKSISTLSERTAKVETKLDNVNDKLSRIDTRLDRMDSRFDTIEAKLNQLLQKK